MIMMEEHEFRRHADKAMNDLHQILSNAAETDPYDADLREGNVVVEFENPPAKFIVSPNTPARQIWVSAHNRSFKLSWDEQEGTFVVPETGQTLTSLMRQVVAKQLTGEDISF